METINFMLQAVVNAQVSQSACVPAQYTAGEFVGGLGIFLVLTLLFVGLVSAISHVFFKGF